MNIKQTNLYKLTRNMYHAIVNPWFDMRRRFYFDELEKTLLEINESNDKTIDNLSIISSNCFAGRVMQDLKIEYNSPTLGLYFMYPDYIKFLSNLKFYLTEAKIEFVSHSKYPLGDERRAHWSHWFPIGLLNGEIEIDFLHYHSEKEAEEKWYRRCERVNLDNLLIVGMQQNLCRTEDIISFDNLPYKNKIFFSNIDLNLKSVEYMPEFRAIDGVGDPYKDGHLFYKHLIMHFDKIIKDT